MHTTKLITMLMLVVLLAACGGRQTPTPAPTVPPPTPTNAPVQPTETPKPTEAPQPAQLPAGTDPLAGTRWLLTTLGGQPAVVTTTVTLNFGADYSANGSDGCNTYQTSYTINNQNLKFQTPVVGTTLACVYPIMQQAAAYLSALEQTATYQSDAQSLTLFNAGSQALATFTAQGSTLAGTAWDVISYNNGAGAVVSVINGSGLTANFGTDGQLTGFAGCNDYSAGYKTDGGQITIGPAVATRKACESPQGVMDQETQYLAALSTAASYQMDAGKLELRTAAGALAASFQLAAANTATGSTALDPKQISLDTQGLPYSWQAVVVPEKPYDTSQPPGPTGLPEHIEILFGATSPADRQPGSPIMYLIPVDAYRQMWDQAGNPSVSQSIDQIAKLSHALPSPAPISGMPALPSEEVGAGFNDLAVQVGRAVSGSELITTSATQTGYRFVGRWAQDANPVTNHGLRYVYQGFTNDGKYLVSFWYPVSTAALPNDVSGVPADQMSAFNANSATYLANMASTLNSLPPDKWTPSLTTLDALVASLQIKGMPVAGIQDKTWLWKVGPIQPGSPQTVQIPNPEAYQVVYGSDGTIKFVADCNSGSMTYGLRQGGMAGGMLAQPGPMTLAQCGPRSYSDGFVSALTAAQNYRVRPGGTTLELILPAGGGTLLLEAK